MSRSDYVLSQKLSVHPFYALLMAAMRNADTHNLEKLQQAFPQTWNELKERYSAPGGCINQLEYDTEFLAEWSNNDNPE